MNVLLTRAALSILLVFVFVLVSNAAERPQSVKVANDPVLSNKIPSEAQLGALKSLGKDVKVDWNKENATPIFLYGNLNSTKSASSAEAAAIQFMSANSVLFKLKNPMNELEMHSQDGDELGYTHIKYDQQVNGVPVWGSQLGVHINNGGQIYCVSGDYHPTIEIATSPAVLEQNAKQVAMDDLKKTEKRPIDSKGTLVVFPWQGGYLLCWNVEVFGTQPNDIDWQYFVDAVTGEVVFKYNDIKYDGPVVGSGTSQDGTTKALKTYLYSGLYYLIDATKPMYSPPVTNHVGTIETYDAFGDSLSNPSFAAYNIYDSNGDNVFNESSRYPAAVDLHRNLASVYDYYYNSRGRNSWDGAGSSIKGIVHYGTNYDNSFWNSYYNAMFFGDGGSTLYRLSYGLDWVAHEFTHGVTQSTANLVYQAESGALNESFSDVFACIVDSLDWNFAEDITIPSPGYLRNLQNPHLGANPYFPFGNQPMVMSEYVYLASTVDNGGVHINSGIPNHAAYLVASRIGRYKTSRIYYRALANYLGPTSIFIHAFWSIRQSAFDLYGNGAEVNAVDFAFDSVGIAPTGSNWNLSYDDGSPSFYYYSDDTGLNLAGEFYLPGTAKIESVSYYVVGDHVGGNASFRLKLFEDSLNHPEQSPSLDLPTAPISSLPRWVTYDLSSYNKTFSRKMYVAMCYDGTNQPELGFDTSSSWQSWWYNGSTWLPDSAIYFVRATVSVVTATGEEIMIDLPMSFSLDQNYPNPFNNSTLITYSVPRPSPVRFEVVNILGQVITSKELGLRQPGVYSQPWDGTDGNGKAVPSGVYFYRVKAGELVQTKKMVLLK
jgi:Zn-dependent metalloprotease